MHLDVGEVKVTKRRCIVNIIKKITFFIGLTIVYGYIFFTDLYFCINVKNEIIKNTLLILTLLAFSSFPMWGVGFNMPGKDPRKVRTLAMAAIVFFVYILNLICHYHLNMY